MLFGANIDPVWQDPDAPLRQALHAENLDLDLITIQDHPYQAVFHDPGPCSPTLPPVLTASPSFPPSPASPCAHPPSSSNPPPASTYSPADASTLTLRRALAEIDTLALDRINTPAAPYAAGYGP